MPWHHPRSLRRFTRKSWGLVVNSSMSTLYIPFSCRHHHHDSCPWFADPSSSCFFSFLSTRLELPLPIPSASKSRRIKNRSSSSATPLMGLPCKTRSSSNRSSRASCPAHAPSPRSNSSRPSSTTSATVNSNAPKRNATRISTNGGSGTHADEGALPCPTASPSGRTAPRRLGSQSSMLRRWRWRRRRMRPCQDVRRLRLRR